MRPIIIFLFVLAIWGAVALDVNVTSPNAGKVAEDEARDKNSPKRPRNLHSVGVALLDAAMKALEQVKTQITEVNRRQELTIGQLQLQVSQLSTKTMKLQEEMEKFRAQLNSTPSHSAGAIGFHARLTQSISTPQTQFLVVDRVVYNSGGGYDPTTGVFTAPVTGLYLFLANMAADASRTDAWIMIILDSRELCRAWSRYSTEMELASCHAATRMVKGQIVRILARGQGRGRIRGNGWTTFTGVLIQADD